MPIERAASDREPWALMPSSRATFPGPRFECSPKSMRNRMSGAGFMDLGRNQVNRGLSLYQKCATLFGVVVGGSSDRSTLHEERLAFPAIAGKGQDCSV